MAVCVCPFFLFVRSPLSLNKVLLLPLNLFAHHSVHPAFFPGALGQGVRC